jgi:hypothetical protein
MSGDDFDRAIRIAFRVGFAALVLIAFMAYAARHPGWLALPHF